MTNERTLTVSWDDPTTALTQAMTLPGIDYLQAMMRNEVPSAPIGSLLAISFTEVTSGRVVVRGVPGEQHFNPIGLVHGGYLSTMLDSAMGCAVHTTLDAGVGYATSNLVVNMVRPVSANVPELFAEGTVVYRGRKQATTEGRVTDADGKLYAHGTSVCLIIGG